MVAEKPLILQSYSANNAAEEFLESQLSVAPVLPHQRPRVESPTCLDQQLLRAETDFVGVCSRRVGVMHSISVAPVWSQQRACKYHTSLSLQARRPVDSIPVAFSSFFARVNFLSSSFGCVMRSCVA